MPDERPPQRARPDRPPFQAARPFRPGPRPDAAPPQPPHTIRVRDGDREIEVSGSPAFVRQVLDDLHNIWGRLHGEAPRQPASIRMPAPAAADDGPAAAISEDTAG